MRFMKGKLLSALLIVVLSAGILSLTLPFGKAQTGTNVSYIINSDTTWTQANSPYNFTGNVLVNQGVTLTIGSDATVNLNSYYLRVNGTLIIQPGATINMGLIGDGIDVYGTMSAEGTSANPVYINGNLQGHIIFAACSAVTFFHSSIGWNQQTNSGSLIEYTIFNQTGLEVQSGIEISDNTFLSGGLTVESASPIIVNNDIETSLSVIQNPNVPYPAANSSAYALQPEISGNIISGGLSLGGGGGIVEDNTIRVGNNNPNSGYIGALSLDDDGAGISTLIVRNLIESSNIGVSCNILYSFNNKAIIENNTITNNTVGVQIGSQNVPSIINNNIYGNSYNAKLSGVSSQISLPNNWWGTTNIQAINQTMYDFKYDFTLGTINFLPILEAQNPQATPNSSAASPATSTPTQSSTSVPSVPEYPYTAIAITLILVASLATLLCARKLRRSLGV